MEEKCHLQSRIEDLDIQLAESVKKLTAATAAYKKVRLHFHNVISRPRHMLRIEEAYYYTSHVLLSVCLSA